MRPQDKKQSSLEKKLEVPLPLSIWWFMAGIFLLFLGIFIFAAYRFSGFVNSHGGSWSIFTTVRPSLTPYSGPQDIRWGTFYLPAMSLERFYQLAPVAFLFGGIMMAIRYLTMQSLLKKYKKQE